MAMFYWVFVFWLVCLNILALLGGENSWLHFLCWHNYYYYYYYYYYWLLLRYRYLHLNIILALKCYYMYIMNMQISGSTIEVICFKIHAQNGSKGKTATGWDTICCSDIYVNYLNQDMALTCTQEFCLKTEYTYFSLRLCVHLRLSCSYIEMVCIQVIIKLVTT